MLTNRLFIGLSVILASSSGFAAEPVLTFETDVRPILKAYCLDCHGGAEKLSGKLDLRLKRLAEAGGSSGASLVPRHPEKSLLIERMKTGEMPPGEKKVPPEQIAIIEKWIASGAATLRPEPESLPPGLGITAEERAFWFYQPLRRVEPPRVEPADRVRTPIDAFILAKLRSQNLEFAADADRATLLRRASLDLTGLPPSQEELDAFVNDPSADAYEKQLDRLMATPAYGERWGRHWLDAAGYAESHGDGSNDTPRAYAWRYRDYVIRAFNSNKPLNQFIIEQLAGDELVPRPWTNLKPDQVELLLATGFLRTAPDNTVSGGSPADREQVVTDTLKIVTSTLLGSSVACAQCHDHRYDPIPQRDYYQLRAIFEPALDSGQWRGPNQRRVSLFTDADRAKAAAIDAEAAKMQAELNDKQAKAVRAAFEKEIAKFPMADQPKLKAAFDTPADKRTEEQKKLVATNPKLNVTPGVLYQYDPKVDGELKAMQAKINARRAERPKEEFVSVLDEVPGRLPETKLFHRGDARQPKGSALPPADLTIAAPEGQRQEFAMNDASLPTSGRRLAWAKHLTNGQHPLFNRVMVNRLWLNHFGRGIVDTPGEFGKLGQKPTHPELLDWLATELPRRNWDLRAMHKLIMTSTVYRQSSVASADRLARDADNALYSRFPLRRLEAEAVRDRILLVAGRLDRTLYGPSVPVVEDATGQIDVPDNQPRRSVYLQSRRSKPVAFLTTFDAPAGELNCERRLSTTSSMQSLMLLNGEFVRKQASHLTRRVIQEAARQPDKEPADASLTRLPTAWQYGYGEVDEKSNKTARFQPLPHFTGSSWQGGAALPDAKLGWVILHATGGHAGNDAQHAAIRRWIAPRDGVLSITGQLGHASPNGDGVRGRIISSRDGLVKQWSVKTTSTATDVPSLAVKASDQIDFAVDCLTNVTSDSFNWTVKLTLSGGGQTEIWDSSKDFAGPPNPPLPQLVRTAWQLVYLRQPSADELKLSVGFLKQQTAALRGKTNDPEAAALTNLCQQLLASNEFLYVD